VVVNLAPGGGGFQILWRGQKGVEKKNKKNLNKTATVGKSSNPHEKGLVKMGPKPGRGGQKQPPIYNHYGPHETNKKTPRQTLAELVQVQVERESARRRPEEDLKMTRGVRGKALVENIRKRKQKKKKGGETFNLVKIPGE